MCVISSQGRIQDFLLRGERATPLGGHCRHPTQSFVVKMYAKTKELSLAGRRGRAGPWIRQCFSRTNENVKLYYQHCHDHLALTVDVYCCSLTRYGDLIRDSVYKVLNQDMVSCLPVFYVRETNFCLIWFVNQRAFSNHALSVVHRCCPLLALVLVSSVHLSPCNRIRHRNFIFGIHMHTCPSYKHIKYLVILADSF